jgi:hypothetical protein
MTQDILTPADYQKPRIVTLAELQRVLNRYTFGIKWAEDAIVDLWKTGAPMPQAANEPERRVLLPGQFAKWWTELAHRMGYAANGRQSYNEISPLFRTSGGTGYAGPTQRRR